MINIGGRLDMEMLKQVMITIIIIWPIIYLYIDYTINVIRKDYSDVLFSLENRITKLEQSK